MLSPRPAEPDHFFSAVMGEHIDISKKITAKLLAAVDLGSNSFRLQIGREAGDQIYPLDSLKETVRLGAGLTPEKTLDAASQQRALEALKRFGERLRDFSPETVRAVGTNTLRVAKNGAEFLKKAEAALGFPIEVIAGREEARLIYLGVSHSVPLLFENRLVIDVGGGSTELIIGRGYEPALMESLYMGCVSYSLKYFPDGKIDKQSLRQAELAARKEVQMIAEPYRKEGWLEAVGSSGTIKALTYLLELNGFSPRGITPDGLNLLRDAMIKAGNVNNLKLEGMRADRTPVLPGGFAIVAGLFAELGLKSMQFAEGALRLGVLYDLLGRSHEQDMRDVTVSHFRQRYHIDAAQTQRVWTLAAALFESIYGARSESPASARAGTRAELRKFLEWSANLHEIGVSIAHNGYHKHSAYIVKHADMPGFSRMDQDRLSDLLLAHRGKLARVQGALIDPAERNVIFCLRVAVLICRSRNTVESPALSCSVKDGAFQLGFDRKWLDSNPLTEAALQEEVNEWQTLGVTVRLKEK